LGGRTTLISKNTWGLSKRIRKVRRKRFSFATSVTRDSNAIWHILLT
jgi:hypothetical protein